MQHRWLNHHHHSNWHGTDHWTCENILDHLALPKLTSWPQSTAELAQARRNAQLIHRIIRSKNVYWLKPLSSVVVCYTAKTYLYIHSAFCSWHVHTSMFLNDRYICYIFTIKCLILSVGFYYRWRLITLALSSLSPPFSSPNICILMLCEISACLLAMPFIYYLRLSTAVYSGKFLFQLYVFLGLKIIALFIHVLSFLCAYCLLNLAILSQCLWRQPQWSICSDFFLTDTFQRTSFSSHCAGCFLGLLHSCDPETSLCSYPMKLPFFFS